MAGAAFIMTRPGNFLPVFLEVCFYFLGGAAPSYPVVITTNLDSLCYTLLMMIFTHDPARRARWHAVFGVDQLPVKTDLPRVQAVAGREILAYDLDAARLHPMAAARFAAYATRKTAVPHGAADIDGWPIPADGCQLAGVGMGKGRIAA